MNKTNDMTVGSPTKGILRFAGPLVLGYILQQLYLVIDASIVGRWVGVNALAAIGSSASVMFLILGFCNGSSAGFAIPIAQSFGAKDYKKMRVYVANAVRIAVVLSIVVTVVSCMLCTRILRIVNTPEEIMPQAWIFLFFQFLAIPFTVAYDLLSSFIRALGNSKQPFYFIIIASVLNIVLDFIFILGLRMGVEGAGLATLLSQAIAAFLCEEYIRREMKILIPRGEERRYNNKRVSILLNNGIPMGLQFSITGIGVIMLQSANNALGTVYVASFTAAVRIKYLFVSVFDNLGMALATYCGQNIGARNLPRIKAGMWAATKIMFCYVALVSVVILPFADYIMMLFVNGSEQEVIQNAALFMRTANYFYPILGFLCILRYSMQGMGYSNLSMFSGVMEMISRIGVSLWVVPAFGFIGVCYGDPVAWIGADLFLFPAMYFLYKHLKRRI